MVDGRVFGVIALIALLLAALAFVSVETPWSALNSFPTACPTNQFISRININPTCSIAEPLSQPTPCTSGNFVTSVNESSGTGILTITCKLGGGSATEAASSPAACGAGNWVGRVTEDVSGTLTLTCSAPLQETASNCAGGAGGTPHQYAMNETSAGALQCALLAWASLTGFPTGCGVGNFVQAVGLTLTCAADNPAEAASSPSACGTHQWVMRVVESAAGVLTLTCSQPSYSDISGHIGTANETASSPSACGAGNYLAQVTEAASGVLTLSCAKPTNMAFTNNGNSCTTSAVSAQMAGFGVTYTTQGNTFLHTVTIILDFEVQAPAAAHTAETTTYILKYGMGAAPSCKGSVTGTSVGNTYEVGMPSAYSSSSQYTPGEETAVISGLSASTTYWFDLDIASQSVLGWVYSLPQLSVIES